MSLTSKSLPTSQMRVDRSISNAEEPESVSYARGSPYKVHPIGSSVKFDIVIVV